MKEKCKRVDCQDIKPVLSYFTSFLFIVLTGFIAPAHATAPTPAVYGFHTPSPNPGAPGSAFVPPLLGSTAGPQTAEWTRSGSVDNALVLAGPSMAQGSFRFFGQTTSNNAKVIDHAPSVSDNVAATVIIPAGLPKSSMYLVWPKSSTGTFGMPVGVNQTDAWWVGPNPTTITAGDTVSVYGRNLALSCTTNCAHTASHIFIKPANAAGLWVTPSAVNPYKVDFKMPALKAGNYEIWTHNGHGGEFGWSGPLNITVLSTNPWAGQTTSIVPPNVKTPCNGKGDDGPAIQKAISAARAGSNVSLPTGVCVVGANAITMKKGVTLSGQGASATTVQPTTIPNWGQALINFTASQYIPATNNAGLANLNITSGNLNVFPVGAANVSNIRIANTTLNWMGHPSNGPRLAQITNLQLLNNTFIGSSLQGGVINYATLQGNTCRQTDKSEYCVKFLASSHIAFTGNSAADYTPGSKNPAYLGYGRLFVVQPDTPISGFYTCDNIYIGSNITKNYGPTLGIPGFDTNVGEQIMFEIGQPKLAANPISVTANSATFASAPPQNSVNTVMVTILSGRGTGESRLAKVSGKTINLTTPWSVIPDKTSLIGVGPGLMNAVAYGNHLQGKTTAPSLAHYAASTGVTLYGTVSNFVFANNTLQRMWGGVVAESSVYGATDAAPSPLFFNMTVNNTLDTSYYGMFHNTEFYAGNGFSPNVIAHMGNVHRNNVMTNIATRGINLQFDYQSRTGGSFDQNVWEHNTSSNLPVAMGVDNISFGSPYATNNTKFTNLGFYKNAFTRGSVKPSGTAVWTATTGTTTSKNLPGMWCEKSNSWAGFQSTKNPCQ